MSSGAAEAVWCCSTCGAIYHKDFPRCPNDGGEVVVSATDPILGKTIGRYVIDRFLGEGGMGRVYEAHHATLANKRYAVKVLLGDAGATPSMRKRFAKEAESASRLVHPNVVGVIDYGSTEGGLPYIVMDFVDGRSIAEMIEDGPIAVPHALRLARAICDGLAYAHEAGVVHRDLKPANILVVHTSDGDEVPRIADFGLAQTVEDNDVRLTSTGMAMGTPAYAAPEQMAGKRVDHRADMYALGMTLFEMLSGGELPFEGSPIEISSAKTHREAPTVSERFPEIAVPADLQAIISKLIRRKREERYHDAREVLAALDSVRFEAVVHTPQLTLQVRREASPWKWLGLAAVVVFLATFVGGWWYTHRGDTAESAPPPTAAATPPLVPAAPPVVVASDPAPQVAQAEPTEPAEPAEDMRLDPPTPAGAPAKPKHKRAHTVTPRKAVVAKTERVEPRPDPIAQPAPAATPPATPLPAPVSVPLPAPAVKPKPSIASVDVHGSLPVAEIRRAVDRVVPALERCAPDQPQSLVVELSVGEARKAENVRASGGAAATDSCVAAAFSSIRTESAPDVGDATVTVKVAFVVK